MDCIVCGEPEDHEHEAVIVREGASQRTADELSATFLADVADVTADPDVIALASEWLSVLASHRNPHTGIAWLPEENKTHTPEALSDDVSDAEEALGEKGFAVVWEDGYVIYDLERKSKELTPGQIAKQDGTN